MVAGLPAEYVRPKKEKGGCAAGKYSTISLVQLGIIFTEFVTKNGLIDVQVSGGSGHPHSDFFSIECQPASIRPRSPLNK